MSSLRGTLFFCVHYSLWDSPVSPLRLFSKALLAVIDVISLTRLRSNKIVHRQVSLHYSPLQATIMRERISESGVLVTILWRPEGPPERRRKNLTVTTF